MSYALIQTDTAAQDGPMKACAVGVLAAIPRARQMSAAGPAGSVEVTISVAANSTKLAFMLQSAPGEPGGSTWPSGDVTSRLNITDGPGTMHLDGIWACRVTSGGVLVGSYGSLTGFHTTLSPGVKVHAIPVSAIAGAEDDELYLVYQLHNPDPLIIQSVGITPDQTIDTPIVGPPARGVTPDGYGVAATVPEALGVALPVPEAVGVAGSAPEAVAPVDPSQGEGYGVFARVIEGAGVSGRIAQGFGVASTIPEGL